ncbi:DUF6157 family protein [Dietzia sp.]|uniref:DUF6157 family protein n=1 Tax=Dietzia sp. TaxID=1871616 RepID=UPI002FDB1ADD
MHITDYVNTVILPSVDTRAESAAAPPAGRRTVAELQYERLEGRPYEWTSDELLFDVHCERKGIAEAERAVERERFFSKGQPCLRTSPLAKTYGWGFHFDADGRVALVPMGSEDLESLAGREGVAVERAMRSSR